MTFHCDRCGVDGHTVEQHSFKVRRQIVLLRQGKRSLFGPLSPELKARNEALIEKLIGLFPELRQTYEHAKSLRPKGAAEC